MNKEVFKAFVEATGLSDKDQNLVKGVMYDYLGSAATPAPQSADVMTLEECMNQIAELKSYSSYDEMESWYIDNNPSVNVAVLITYAMREAAELYASQFKAKADQLQAELEQVKAALNLILVEVNHSDQDKDDALNNIYELAEQALQSTKQ